jgi:hypothetical protein
MRRRILIGCEESQVVCQAFRDRGHEAYSCDLVETRGRQDWHYQADVMEIIPSRRWDLIILHPDCTKLAVSGNRWYGKDMPKHHERIEAINWTTYLWETAILYSDRVGLENPISVIFQYLDYDRLQYIQPWQFGHGETKKTGLALHNLPELKPTNIVEGREQRIWRMAPSPTRKRDRSETFQGIADAMADQWGIF